MFARREKARPGITGRSVVALGLALGTGAESSIRADFPVVVRSYSVMPASVTVVSSPIVVPTSFVVAPTTYVRYETVSLPIVPTVTWIPGISYIETAEWLPVEMPCGATVIETPVAGTVMTGSPILSSPQSKAVEELPVESVPQESKPSQPAKASETPEPPLTHGKETPPGLPELPVETSDKPGESPVTQAPAAKPAESKPAAEKAPAAKAAEPKEEEIPPNLPSPPVNPLPAAKEPLPKEPARTEAVKQDPPKNTISLPGAEQPKSSTPVDPPPAAPAEESRTEPLVAPGAPQIPLPDTAVPELAPVPDSKVTAEKAKAAADSGATGKPDVTKTTRSLPDIPPPADDLPPLNPKKEDSSQPVAPLPELPLPGELPPAKEVQDSSLKPVDPEAVKASDSKPGDDAKTRETSALKREVQRPVIESKPGGAGEKAIAELDIIVRLSRSSSPESGVQVRFRENASGERFEAVTDAAGRARVVVPQGTWEVEVASVGGQRFVLGDVISKSGRLTTASGRDLPRLEIDR